MALEMKVESYDKSICATEKRNKERKEMKVEGMEGLPKLPPAPASRSDHL